MSTFTPNFNIEVPTPATQANELGEELLAFGMSVDQVLRTFNYDGADPNLVLARVAALEAWRASMTAWKSGVDTFIAESARKLGYKLTTAETSGTVQSGTTLQPVTGPAATSLSISVTKTTEVLITVAANLIPGPGPVQIGASLSGATTYVPPVDSAGVGKAPASADMTVSGLRVTTLSPGVTTITLSARGPGSGTSIIRNPSILVQAL